MVAVYKQIADSYLGRYWLIYVKYLYSQLFRQVSVGICKVSTQLVIKVDIGRYNYIKYLPSQVFRQVLVDICIYLASYLGRYWQFYAKYLLSQLFIQVLVDICKVSTQLGIQVGIGRYMYLPSQIFRQMVQDTYNI